MIAYIHPLHGDPPGIWGGPPEYVGGGPMPGRPGHVSPPIALPPEIWPTPPKPPGEVSPPIFIPGGGIIMPPIAIPGPGGIVTPPIYYPPTIWPTPPGPGLPGIPTGKMFVAVYTGRSGWHAAIVDVPETAQPKK